MSSWQVTAPHQSLQPLTLVLCKGLRVRLCLSPGDTRGTPVLFISLYGGLAAASWSGLLMLLGSSGLLSACLSLSGAFLRSSLSAVCSCAAGACPAAACGRCCLLGSLVLLLILPLLRSLVLAPSICPGLLNWPDKVAACVYCPAGPVQVWARHISLPNGSCNAGLLSGACWLLAGTRWIIGSSACLHAQDSSTQQHRLLSGLYLAPVGRTVSERLRPAGQSQLALTSWPSVICLSIAL